jgi:dTDP-glucose pyrophosphorylase/CBS domain-containing protein
MRRAGIESRNADTFAGNRSEMDSDIIRDIEPYCVHPDLPISEVIARIDRNAEGVALIVDSEVRLIGTVTDGDIRRAILRGVDLAAPVSTLWDADAPRPHSRPITAAQDASPIQVVRLMGEYAIRHLPLIDDDGRVVALALLSRLIRRNDLPMRAVIMAGGFGTRLRPLTHELPKPMLPVGDRPLLQRTIEDLRKAGIRHIDITTHFEADKIRDHVGDGSPYDAVIHYNHEDEPLGTAGALRVLRIDSTDPLLVINGDILTTVNYAAMLEYHRENEAEMTVAVRNYSMTVPYGVVDCAGPAVLAIREKPKFDLFVNAGLYLVEPRVCKIIPADCRFDMTELISLMIEQGRRVVSFPIHEYWLDIGQIEDYERAQQDVASGVVSA